MWSRQIATLSSDSGLERGRGPRTLNEARGVHISAEAILSWRFESLRHACWASFDLERCSAQDYETGVLQAEIQWDSLQGEESGLSLDCRPYSVDLLTLFCYLPSQAGCRTILNPMSQRVLLIKERWWEKISCLLIDCSIAVYARKQKSVLIKRKNKQKSPLEHWNITRIVVRTMSTRC